MANPKDAPPNNTLTGYDRAVQLAAARMNPSGRPKAIELVSDAPVNYASGVQHVAATDLESDAFGQTWSYTRTWTGLNESSQNGNGWSVLDQPYLVLKENQYAPAQHGGLVTVVSGDNYNEFVIGSDETSTAYKPRYASQDGLVYVPPTTGPSGEHISGEYRMTDEAGDVATFYDLPRDIPDYVPNSMHSNLPRLYGGSGYAQQATQQWYDPATGATGNADVSYRFGAFKSFTDASTHLTITAAYDSAGNVASLTRTDGSGVSEKMSFGYAVDPTHTNIDPVTNNLGGSATLVRHALLSRQTTATGSWVSIRRADYDYYTGSTSQSDSAYGRLGDLKLVTILDFQKNPSGSGEVVDHTYYRYNKLSGYQFDDDGSYGTGDGFSSRGPTNDPATTGGNRYNFSVPRYDFGRFTSRYLEPLTEQRLPTAIKAA